MITNLAECEIAYAEAFRCFKTGDLKTALEKALRLYAQVPRWAGSHRLLGHILWAQREGHRAEAAWRRALFYDHADAESLLGLLGLLRHQAPAARVLVQSHLENMLPSAALASEVNRLYQAGGELTSAEQPVLQTWTQRVLARWPHNLDTLDLSGYLAYVRGDKRGAVHCWRQLMCLSAQQDLNQAFKWWCKLLPLDPGGVAWGYQAAVSLLECKDYVGAEAYLALCCKHPAEAAIPADVLWAQRAIGFHHLGDHGGVRHSYQRATALAPHPYTYRWAELCALPFVYDSREHLQLTRQRFKVGAERLFERLASRLERGKSVAAPLRQVCPPFLLAYQGQNDRSLMQFLGRNWERLLQSSGRQLICDHVPDTQRPLRVGFVSRHFFKHSVLVCYGRTISLLAQDPRFEVVCLHLGQHRDAWTRELAAQVSQFVYLAGQEQPERLILEQRLDVLIYTDIGMDNQTYRLGLHRLAPIQCVLAGHPVTTGLPQIDYFLSSQGEHPDADSHYTESLVRLRGNLSRHRPLELPVRLATRQELGLSERAHVYVCPMTLFKVHPDFDDALAAILCEDPLGELYFFCDAHGNYHLLLQRRLQRRFPELAARIHFLPWMSQADFYSVISAADVVLDTFHFGGGTTSRMVLGLGQPYVSWPGEFLRSRSTRGASLRLGVPECLATDADDYVRIALRLAREPDFRADLQARIRENANKLFVTQRKPQGLMRFLLAAAQAWPARLTELTPPFGVSQSPQLSDG